MPETPASIAGLMLADERVALWVSTTPPADPAKITITELASWENFADRCFADGTYMRATGSETLNRRLVSGGNKQGFGASNYEAQVDVARYLDADGHAIEEEDFLWTATKKKGTTLFIAKRVGPRWDTAPAAKDEVSVFKVTTDTAQDPQTFGDYIEKIVPLAVQDAWLDQVLTSA